MFSHLQDKEAVNELFTEIAGKIAGRNGGYTRILKIAETRVGDSAETAYIELVDYNENMLKTAKTATKKRSRRGTGKTDKKAVEAETKTETKAEETAEDKAAE